jgi:ATP dependent DNA ligase domain
MFNFMLNFRFSAELQGDRNKLLQVAQQFELEGLIAKKPDSVYESGRRSGAWVKFKITKSQEFVIGGYTPPEGSRKYFGSLISDRWLPEPAGITFCRQGRHWLLRKSLGRPLRRHAKAQAHYVPICEPAGEKTWAMDPKPHPCNYETLFLGRTSIGRPGQVHGVDARWPASSAGFPGVANRQGGERRRSRIKARDSIAPGF